MSPFRRPMIIILLAAVCLCQSIAAVPMPSPVQRSLVWYDDTPSTAMPTPHVPLLPIDASPDAVYAFYTPGKRMVQPLRQGERQAEQLKGQDAVAHLDAPTPVRRSDSPSVPLSQLGPPSFPAQYPSCYNCQQKYSSLSSCMEASSVFQNATSIFNSPLSYIAVIKCACTDTFQAVYPQCLQCFQMTDQCYYLGTDPKGTGAWQIITNIRQICALGSSLLGGAEKHNYPDYNNTFTPSTVPGYTDVTTTGPGYYDQATGAIFGNAGAQSAGPLALPRLVVWLLCAFMVPLLLLL